MRKFKVTGMSCAACSARVEKAVSALEGVSSCSVNLLTNSMGVIGSVSDGEIIKAVCDAGYGASAEGNGDKKSSAPSSDALKNKEIPTLILRLAASSAFLLILMYIAMGHGMWSWPLPHSLAKNPIAIALCQLILSAAVMLINQKFFVSGARALVHLAPNMDTLVALGSAASFVYSTYRLFLMTEAQMLGGADAARHYLHGLYFESAAMILTLITVGKLLEAISKGRTTSALKGLMDLSPKTATVLRDGQEVTVSVDEVRIGDVFTVRPGESIPVDGVILEGDAALDESALSGESLPVDKSVGDAVFTGTLNFSGYIKCRAEKVGEDTSLSKIIQIVNDASATKAPIARAADRVSGVFVPAVMAISLVTAAVWAICGRDAGFVLARAISVLVISCPCALGLATPVAIMVGSGVGARRGILFKTAQSLEITGRARIAVLDKTGTLTRGEMTVTDILPAQGVSREELVSLCLSLEKQSEHPIAAAIVSFGESEGAVCSPVKGFRAVPGRGVTAELDGKTAVGGKLDYIREFCAVPPEDARIAERLEDAGKTATFFAAGERFMGVCAVADTLKDDSADAIAELKRMGIYTVMLTGDNERTARAIGRAVGVDRVIAGVLPDGKAAVVEALAAYGRVIMVGDGINDAPALVSADSGIAIGAGTDVAIDAADVVLVKSSPSSLPTAIKLSRATLRNIHQNLFWAFFYNAIGIPLAAGVWIPLFGWELDPMFGAAAMSLSSFCVVSNALRLNLINVTRSSRPSRRSEAGRAAFARKAFPEERSVGERLADAEKTNVNETNISKGENEMKKTVRIEGMMCPHCSGRVKKCLEELEGVASADVSHESGEAIVTLAKTVSDESLRSTVEDAGYKVLGIE